MSENLPVHVLSVVIGRVPPDTTSGVDPAALADRARRIRRMISLARLMDSAIKIPGTNLTFGLDPLIGFIPILGDIITTGVSIVIIYDAVKLGATSKQTLQMVFNVCLDFIIGEIPALGDAFDFAWKSNLRNLAVMGIDPNQVLPPRQ